MDALDGGDRHENRGSRKAAHLLLWWLSLSSPPSLTHRRRMHRSLTTTIPTPRPTTTIPMPAATAVPTACAISSLPLPHAPLSPLPSLVFVPLEGQWIEPPSCRASSRNGPGGGRGSSRVRVRVGLNGRGVG